MFIQKHEWNRVTFMTHYHWKRLILKKKSYHDEFPVGNLNNSPTFPPDVNHPPNDTQSSFFP